MLLRPTTISFAGDIRIPSTIDPKIHFPFSKVSEWLDESDLLVANLEGPIGEIGKPRAGRGAILHNSDSIIEIFKLFPSTLFTLANNHIMDYGASGLANTIKILEQENIPFIGGGMTEDEAYKPYVLESSGLKIGFLSFSTDERHVGSICANGSAPGVANLLGPRAVESIRNLKSIVDRVCVVSHWGHEFHAFPAPSQRKRSKEFVAAGADVIIGHHPHVLQGIEKNGGALIAHSLGNTLFPSFRQSNGRLHVQWKDEKEFLLMKLKFDLTGPVREERVGGKCTKNGQLIPFEGNSKRKFQEKLNQLSEVFSLNNYENFYREYEIKRASELRRIQVLKAIRKIQFSDLSSIRFEDVKRQWKRIRSKSSN